jgi:phenylalanyl-tRNA synthetase alpha chain
VSDTPGSAGPAGGDPARELEAGLDAIEAKYAELLAAATDEPALRAANARLIGPSGELTTLLKLMPRLPGELRKPLGQRANAVKRRVEDAFAARLSALEDAARAAELSGPHVDVTLPGRALPPGRLHPITRVAHDLVDVFSSLGFDVAEAPEVELYEYNFDKLGFPPDHPATDMQDSFFVEAGTARPDGTRPPRSVLRTHTSNVQVREMLRRKTPPMAVIGPGAVYRRDDDVTHSPMFFQIEGFLVDEGVSFAHLKGVLQRFADRMFGPGTPLRLRPSYFPFVEPGAEVDIGCMICRGWDGTAGAPDRQAACRVCKGTGFLEVLGCGMIHPVVFEHVGIDPERYTGFAFGMGIDRIAMLRYGISDIRWLYENDVRFLAQV